MSCEFAPGNVGKVACKTTHALLRAKENLENAFTIAELRQELCCHPNPQAQTQCPAYKDLSVHGRASAYCQ